MLAVVELIANYGYCWNVGRATTFISIGTIVDILEKVLDAENKGNCLTTYLLLTNR